jgi:hypothetical protein
MIFGRWELAVADDVYIRNGSRTNIGVQTYNDQYFNKSTTLLNDSLYSDGQSPIK